MWSQRAQRGRSIRWKSGPQNTKRTLTILRREAAVPAAASAVMYAAGPHVFFFVAEQDSARVVHKIEGGVAPAVW